MKRRRRLLFVSLLSFLFATSVSATSTSTSSSSFSTSTPAPRYAQATVYANNTAYFLGGILSDTSFSSDFFCLDLSQEFNSSSPPWQILPSLPTSTSDASAAIGTDGRIYLLGGQTWDCSSNFLNVYDPNTSSWGTPQFFGTAPTRRQDARTFLSNDNEIIYYFAGASTSCSTGTASVYNTLNALSLQNSSWFSPLNSNPPVAESNFALTKVSVGTGNPEQILIIGGETATSNTFVQMSQVALFDMESESWTFVTATTASGQDTPEERVGHTAVTAPDGMVIVYGGTVGPSDRAAVPQLAVLNTTSIPFEWSTPITTGNSSGPAAGLTGHSAIMTDGNIMILAFGKDGNGNFNEQTYFLDTQKMEWQSTYTPTTTQAAPPSSPDSPSTSTPSTDSANSPSHTAAATNSNPHPSVTPSADDSNSSKSTTTKIAVSTTIPLALLGVAGAAVLIIFFRRRRRRQRSQNRTSKQHLLYEMNYLPPSSSKSSSPVKYVAKYNTPVRAPTRGHPSTRVFKRIFSRGKAHASPPPRPPPLGVFLPAWAQLHAESRFSGSANGEDEDEMQDPGMVQVASMSFVAPKMQLRVVNPDQESLNEEESDTNFRRRVSSGRQV